MDKNKIKLEQFVGSFTNAISDELCSEFIDCFNGHIRTAGLTTVFYAR